LKNTKKYSVKSNLLTLFQNEELQYFLGSRDRLKESSTCLTGWGVDYNKSEVTSLKVYHKIFDKDLRNISFFTRWFFKDFIHGRDVLNSSIHNASKSLLTSKGGLGGINFAIKVPFYSKPTKAFYIKQKKGEVKVINFKKGPLEQRKYNYLFNKILIKLLAWRYDLNLPDTQHGIEYSIREGKLFASVYPNYKLQKDSLFSFLQDIYWQLSQHDPWPIENEIVKAIASMFPPNIPITKGYISGDNERKIFFGAIEDV